MRLVAKERILLYLLDFARQDPTLEVPPEVTQEGVARGSKLELRHLSQFLRPLINVGLVREEPAHVRGIRQRRKTYGLTEAGAITAIRLREKVKLEHVRVKEGSALRDTTFSRLLDATGGRVPLSFLTIKALEHGSIDLASLAPQTKGSFVEMLADAPRIGKFVGRREELKAILSENGHARIFVIRGVAGIGKSSLGAEVCRFERGKRNIMWHKVRPWDTHQTMFAVMADFLQALDRPGLSSVMKRGENRRAAQVLGEDLLGTNSILVFDDVQEASREMIAFLSVLREAIAKAPDVRALVLTRRTLRFYDSRDTILTGLVKEIDLGGLEPEDIAALFANQSLPPGLIEATHRVRGHPLLLQLMRNMNPGDFQMEIGRGAERFIEDHISAGLTKAEGAVMKTISLFRVPVPRDAVLSNPETTREAFQSLVARLLVRPVGEADFEVHDTIRDYFTGCLTARERGELGHVVVEQLKSLARNASSDAKFTACANYLSNALQLAGSASDKTVLSESLGDANRALGDLAGALVAFRMSAKTTRGKETIVRLHRKVAQTLFEHGEFDAASREIALALRTFGMEDSVERGWLQLVSCRISFEREEIEEATKAGEDALRTFEKFGTLAGRANALLELGKLEQYRGLAERLESPTLTRALDLAMNAGDPKLLANVHFAMADIANQWYGDAGKTFQHLAAIAAIPGILDDTGFACRFFWQRGVVQCELLNDQPSAADDLGEAMRIARRTHDLYIMGQAQLGLGMTSGMPGHADEARVHFEQAAAIFRAEGLLGLELVALWLVADFALWQEDFAGFRQTLERMDKLEAQVEAVAGAGPRAYSSLGRGMLLGLHGYEYLLRGDYERCRASFEEAVTVAEGNAMRLKVYVFNLEPAFVHLYFGIALRVIGSDSEGDEHVAGGLELLAEAHAEGARSLAPKMIERHESVLRRARQNTP